MKVYTDENNDVVLLNGEAIQANEGSSDHSQLTNRNIADQHPISAITNLQTNLNAKVDKTSKNTFLFVYGDSTEETIDIYSVVRQRFNITNNLTNVTNSNDATIIDEGASYSATLTASTLHSISSVTVTMGGTDVTSTVYDSTNHTISITAVTGALVITASATSQGYTVTNNLTDVTNSNTSTIVATGSVYTGTLSADAYYTINTVTITMGGTDITSTAYDSTNHTISIASVTGNLVITASAQRQALPSAYQEVSYIESSGTQYIDTGINFADIQQGCGVDIKYAYLSASTSANQMAIGKIGNSNGRFYISERSTGKTVMTFGSLSSSSAPIQYNSTTDIQVLNCEIDTSSATGIVTLNGEQKPQFNITGTIIDSYNLYLFAANHYSTGSGYEYGNLKMYYTKIYKDDVAVRNLIPCYRKSDNVIGMYDLVSQTFLTNSGTGTFTKGPNITPPILPSAYQQVEYIGATGTQWIDTGVIPFANMECNVRFNVTSMSSDAMIFGVNNPRYYLDIYNSNKTFLIGLNAGKTYSENSYTVGQDCTAKLVNTDLTTLQAYVDDVLVATATGNLTTYSTAMALFCRRDGTSADQPMTGNIYSFNVKDSNSQYIANLIPCYRKSDNVIGMYDLVSNTFLTNSGTGTFTKGSDV